VLKTVGLAKWLWPRANASENLASCEIHYMAVTIALVKLLTNQNIEKQSGSHSLS